MLERSRSKQTAGSWRQSLCYTGQKNRCTTLGSTYSSYPSFSHTCWSCLLSYVYRTCSSKVLSSMLWRKVNSTSHAAAHTWRFQHLDCRGCRILWSSHKSRPRRTPSPSSSVVSAQTDTWDRLYSCIHSTWVSYPLNKQTDTSKLQKTHVLWTRVAEYSEKLVSPKRLHTTASEFVKEFPLEEQLVVRNSSRTNRCRRRVGGSQALR